MKTTTCDCGREISYTTNKPKRCERCREKREAQFQYKARRPQRSKKEATLQKVLNEIMPDAEYIDNGYYSWLKSPKGSPLQLDRYYPTLKLAFEFNGRQHYEFNRYMHKDMEAFEYLQTCDRKKKKDCAKNGVTLITIKYNKVITKEYLVTRLTEAGVISNIRAKTRLLYKEESRC